MKRISNVSKNKYFENNLIKNWIRSVKLLTANTTGDMKKDTRKKTQNKFLRQKIQVLFHSFIGSTLKTVI